MGDYRRHGALRWLRFCRYRWQGVREGRGEGKKGDEVNSEGNEGEAGEVVDGLNGGGDTVRMLGN